MAAVFLATEEKLHRDVALKVMFKKLLNEDSSFAERFLREARIVASLSHRNIVTVFDVGSDGDYHYMAMELLPGGDLTEKLKTDLPLEKAITYVKDIAEGLQYAGSKNLIHRDIKPDNIMFAEDGRAVITDFGIARDGSSEINMTMVGTVIGTPQYMSPEQASAEILDHRTDLYSLGIILYQILTGRPPFKGHSAISTGVMHITHAVPPLPTKYAQFEAFIEIALAKNPNDRFQSGREFIEALSKISLEPRKEDDVETLLMSSEDIQKALRASKVKKNDELDLLLDLSDEFLSDSSEPIVDEEPVLKQAAKTKPLDSSAQTSSFSGLTLADVVEKPKIEPVKAEKETRDFAFHVPVKFIVLFLLVFGSIASHVFYVNFLGKQIPFFSLTTTLENLTENVLGMKPNFSHAASTLSSSSNDFGYFSEKILAKIFQNRSEIFGLSPKEKQLVEFLDYAIEDKRLYSPAFNCAELYLQELRLINPNSEIVKKRTQQVVVLSLDDTLKLITSKQFDKADELIDGSKRLLPFIEDKQLHLRHRQIASTLIIAR